MALDTDWARDGKTLDSGSAASADDDTDEFGRMIMQHARVDTALDRNSQAFSKARRNPRVSAALAQLDGTLDRRSVSSGASDPGVADHSMTDTYPSLNVPRGWGRKARHNNLWLKNLSVDDQDNARPTATETTELYTKTLGRRSEHVDWATVADRPMQSIEAEPSRRRYGTGSRPHQQQIDPIDRIRQLESEHELTAGSMYHSTPVYRRRSAYAQDTELPQRRHTTSDRHGPASERDTPHSIKDRLEARLSRITGQPVSRLQRRSPDQKLFDDSRDKENVRSDAAHTRTTRQRHIAQAPDFIPNIHINGEHAVHETPRASAMNESRTPKVTGGWVETPLTNRHGNALAPSLETKSFDRLPAELPTKRSPNLTTHEQIKSAASPPRPTSALHSLLHPGRSSPKKELNVGDETLASLEGLLDPTDTLTKLSANLNDEMKAELQKLQNSGRPSVKPEIERREELLSLQGVDSRLRGAGKDGQSALTRPGSSHSTAEHTCANCQRGVLRTAASEFKGFFINRKRGRNDRRWWFTRLTWVGAFLVLSFSWLIAETWACSIYCRPRYASFMIGFGVDYYAPEFPFVIPTVVYRKIAWLLYPFTFLLPPITWLFSTLGGAVWSYLSIPFEADPRPPPQYWPSPTRWTSEPEPTPSQYRPEHTSSQHWSPPAADEDAKDAAPAVIGRLWSWVASPAESAAAAAKHQAALAEEEFWADMGERWTPGADEGVVTVDTAGLWQ